MKGLRHWDTLGDLKSKISKLRPDHELEIKKDGHLVLAEHCFLLYHGISNKTLLDAVPVEVEDNSTRMGHR